MGSRPGSSPGNAPSRYYGERMPSSAAVNRPLSHGGLGTEVVPTPSPVERGNSRQSGGRGSYGGGGRSSAARLDAPAASPQTQTQTTAAATVSPPTSSTISAPTVAFEKRLEPHPVARASNNRQPSRNRAPSNAQSEAGDADTSVAHFEEQAEVEVVVPPGALSIMGSQAERTRDEPKQTTKLSLSFPVKEVAEDEKEKSKMSLNFYGRGQPAPTPSTEEPTYILYPSYSPTTAIPTYAPTGSSESSEDEPPPGADERHGFKEPVNAPAVEDVDGWTWKPTPGDGTAESEEEESEQPSQEDGSEQQEGNSDSLSSIYDKRICPGYPFGVDPLVSKTEEEVFFAYGIQTTEGKHGRSIERSVERMQLWVLEDVAHGLLHCPDSSALGDVRDGKQEVSRVYYVEDDSIATLNPCTPTVTNATGCAIVQSAIYLTATHGHEEEARANALSIVHSRLQRGAYEEGTILHTSYLGPDLDTLGLFNTNKASSRSEEGSSSSDPRPVSFYVAIGVVALAVCALGLYVTIRLRAKRERRRKATQDVLLDRAMRGLVEG
ncbi:hypothetical protein ACHAXT_011043 [Thalassiosira profunda]